MRRRERGVGVVMVVVVLVPLVNVRRRGGRGGVRVDVVMNVVVVTIHGVKTDHL